MSPIRLSQSLDLPCNKWITQIRVTQACAAAANRRAEADADAWLAVRGSANGDRLSAPIVAHDGELQARFTADGLTPPLQKTSGLDLVQRAAMTKSRDRR